MLQSPINPPTAVARRQARHANPPANVSEAVARINAACELGREPINWCKVGVLRVMHGDDHPEVAEALEYQRTGVRPVEVIDPDTDTMGFVLFPMDQARVGL